MIESVSFIGAGRIARIMLGGWKQARVMPAVVLASDANPAAIAALQAEFPEIKAASLDEAAGADLVFGALHPPAMPEMLAAIAGKLKDTALFCSLVPKIKLTMLREKLGGFDRLVRMNPNSPSRVGLGFNPVTFAEALPLADRDEFMALLKPLGQSPQVEEKLLESYAVISAMGPTYFGFQFAAVAQLAQDFGLDAESARQAMRAMLQGTVDLLFASDVPREVALDLVPVRPLAEQEAEITGMLQRQIGGIYAKLTG